MKKRNMSITIAAVSAATSVAPALAFADTLDNQVIASTDANAVNQLKGEIQGFLNTKYTNEANMLKDVTYQNSEKQNLTNLFNSLEENKTQYASIKLNEMLFKNSEQIYLGMGDVTFLEDITSESIYKDYVDMVHNNQLDILISGDVDTDRIKNSLYTLNLKARDYSTNDVFVKPHQAEIVNEKEEISDVTQGNFLLGFSSPAYYMEKNYFSSMVFNGLFGGFPHSKLFQNVREKASLAYSTSSFMDFLRGTMIVHAGIESSKKEEAERIILQQLESMQLGEFEEELVSQTKDMLINQFKQNDDSQSSSLSKVYLNRLITGADIEDEEWIDSLEKVTKQEIINIARNLKLQATFFLKGEEIND